MQPTYAADYVADRSRLTTFFRLLLVIPHMILISLWGIAIYFTAIIAWFAVVITGRYPAGLYEFNASFARYASAVNAYYYLATDEYPPFGGETGSYPVRLKIGPPLEKYSRAKAFFRFILIIPVAIVAYALSIVAGLGALIAWFAIVILGRQPEALQEMINLGVSYQSRLTPYGLLMTEDWPPFQSPPEHSAV